MITYGCAKCGCLLESPGSQAGQPDKCPLCGEQNIVPSQEPSKTANPGPAARYIFAVVACAAIVLAYVVIGVAVGWSNSGGYILVTILFAILGVTWRRITKAGRDGRGEQDEQDE